MSNPVLDAISARRSIRAYANEQITGEQLQTILDAGLAAPSARNAQPWHFTAVQDAALIERVNEATRAQALISLPPDARAMFENPDFSVFHHAPTVVFISCPSLEAAPYAQMDVGIATQNMHLAAHSLGLGSVILGFPRFAFQGPEADALRSALAFPKGHDYCLALAIGVPTATKDAHVVQPDKVTIIR